MSSIYSEMSVADRLIYARGKKSQQEVADAVGVSKNAVSKYESGEMIPADRIKKKLAEYFDMSIEALFF